MALTKRCDTLTKMLDVTKAYAKHEDETLAGIVKLRGGGLASTIRPRRTAGWTR